MLLLLFPNRLSLDNYDRSIDCIFIIIIIIVFMFHFYNSL